MKFKQFAYTTAVAAALGLSASASAAVVNFDQAGASSPTGSVSYDGNGGAFIGNNISFDEISLNNTADAANKLTCQSCTINFQTGNNVSEGSGVGDVWKFAGGGNLALNGTAVDSDGNTVASGDLFSGALTGDSQIAVRTGESSLNASLNGSDDFNADLANYYGLNPDNSFDFSSTAISLGGTSFGGDGSFNANQLQNADVTVKPSAAVPEPQELGLFGLGVALLLAGLGFRRKNGADMG